MNEKSLSRRSFLKMVATLGASGALAWVSSGSVEAAEDIPIIGVDAAEVGGGEPVVFLISTGHTDQPFSYFIEGSAAFEPMYDDDMWGVPDGRAD